MALEYVSGILRNFDLNVMETPAQVLPESVVSASCVPDAAPTWLLPTESPSATCWCAEVSSEDRWSTRRFPVRPYQMPRGRLLCASPVGCRCRVKAARGSLLRRRIGPPSPYPVCLFSAAPATTQHTVSLTSLLWSWRTVRRSASACALAARDPLHILYASARGKYSSRGP